MRGAEASASLTGLDTRDVSRWNADSHGALEGQANRADVALIYAA